MQAAAVAKKNLAMRGRGSDVACMSAVETIFPTVILLGLGCWLTWRGFFQEDFLLGLNRFLYFIALPALILSSLRQIPTSPGEAGKALGVFLLANLLTVLLGYLICRLTKLARSSTGAFLQACFRGNLALIGFPLLLLTTPAEQQAEITADAVLILAPIMFSYNVIGVFLLSLFRTGEDTPSTWRSLLQLRSNPLIIASAGAFILAITGKKWPDFILKSLQMLGNTASPLALICIGGGLARIDWRKEWKFPLLASACKLIVLPFFVLLLVSGVRISAEYQRILLHFAASPVAAASVVLVRQMGGDVSLAGGAIALSTIFSMVALSMVIFFYG